METTLRILDQINVKFENLDPFTRRRIVEATKFMVPYARHTDVFKLGRWDGTVNFATVGGGTYINMLDKVLPIVEDAGYAITLKDERPAFNFQFAPIDDLFLSDKVWPDDHEEAGEPIILRDYQVDAVNRFLVNPQSIQEISTGAGKTIMCGALARLCEQYGRTIVIVPSKNLVLQTEEDYLALDLDVGVYFGERKELNRTHTICTWQSLAVLFKKSKKQQAEFPIGDFVKDVCCVIVDEVHSAKANELRLLLSGALKEVPLRWGLTGTVPKEDFDFTTLLVTLGPVVGHIKASDLQEQGVLANCHVEVIQLKDDHVGFRNYDDEHKWLTTDSTRLLWIARYIEKIAADGNTLVLIGQIETGEALQQMIAESVFVYGKIKAKKRVLEYKGIQTSTNKIIVATYGVAAVGINIPRIFNLVMIEPGKSFVRVIQSIGRGIRKAHDKDFVNIKDIASTCRYSSQHLTKRKAFYRDANYQHHVNKIEYTKGFLP